jgi:hypothetical protein
MKYSIALVCGLGNVVLSLAGFYHIVKEAGLDVPSHTEHLDWIDKPFENGLVLGGHPRQNSLHIGQIFPSIGYKHVKKSLTDEDVNFTLFYCNDRFNGDKLKQVVDETKDALTEWTVVLGWFSDLRYRMTYRDEIVQWLSFGPDVRTAVDKFFRDNTIVPEHTVSLHCRLGSPADFTHLEKIHADDYIKCLSYVRKVHPQVDTVVVCSESKENFEEYLSPDSMTRLGLRYVFYEADPEFCLHAMIECAHHVLSNSTLSYSVMYLDSKFPNRTLVVGTHQDYTPVKMVNEQFISKDGKHGLLNFKDIA